MALPLVVLAVLPVAVVLAAPRRSGPVVRTERPRIASATTARLTGEVNPRGRRTRVRFQYGTTKRYGRLTAAIVLRGDHRTHRIVRVLRGLAPGTTYHVRLTARSRSGLRRGADRTFTTPGLAAPTTQSSAPSVSAAPALDAPTATTQPPSPVLPRAAIAHGIVNPHGNATTYHFEYAHGALSTPSLSAGAGAADVPVSALLPRLAPQQGDDVQLVATSAGGTTRGADVTFSTPPAATAVHATGYTRQTLYHSPQTPGATAWTGAWTMPDGSVMTAFTQATGPVDPAARSHVPESVLNSVGYTEIAARTGFTYIDPHRDFSGLSQSVIYLRSADGGRSWQQWRVDPFHALGQQAMTAQPTIALDDGTLVRRVSGIDALTDPSFPRTAVLEHLSFDPNDSSGQAASWSAPQVVLGDPSVCTYQISRIRPLSDGRYVALGQAWHYLSGQSGRCAPDAFTYLLLVANSAADVESGTWSLGMPYTGGVYPSEWDVAELPSGDLLAMFRSTVKGDFTPKEAILHKTGSTWSMDAPRPVPGVTLSSNSGHPELLATQEGPIIELSAGNVSYTTDAGASWHPLPFPAGASFHPAWYPRAVQAADGTIYVFSHVGFDDAYGAADERIIADRFRLAIDG